MADDGMDDRQYREYLELIQSIGIKGGLLDKSKETKEAKDRETIQLIQSRCKHRRRGVTSDEGYNIVKCLDCGKFFYGEDI